MLCCRNEIEQHHTNGKRLVARDPRPELVEVAEQKAGVARLAEADLIPPPAEIANPRQVKAQAAAIIITAPQALGRLGKQVPGEIRCTVVGAQFRLEHLLMAHAFGEAGGGRLNVDAVQHLMKQEAIDAAPDPAQLERGCFPELGDGEDAGAVKALLHPFADAVDLLQFEAEQNVGQIVLRDDDQAVRLLEATRWLLASERQRFHCSIG